MDVRADRVKCPTCKTIVARASGPTTQKATSRRCSTTDQPTTSTIRQACTPACTNQQSISACKAAKPAGVARCQQYVAKLGQQQWEWWVAGPWQVGLGLVMAGMGEGGPKERGRRGREGQVWSEAGTDAKSTGRARWDPGQVSETGPWERSAGAGKAARAAAKTRCRASEGAPAVVTFQTFYRGDHKTLKNETLASGAISSSSSSPSSSSFTYP